MVRADPPIPSWADRISRAAEIFEGPHRRQPLFFTCPRIQLPAKSSIWADDMLG
jgi:hypothetical protein